MNAISDVRIVSNVEAVKKASAEQVRTALEMIGQTAEGYAKRLCPVDTGLLRNSITHALAGEHAAISEYEDDEGEQKGEYKGTADGKKTETSVYIGTNVEYAAYVELGTGKYYPGGRDTPWAYQDAKGVWHRTEGHREQPYLRPAINDHISEYKRILDSVIKNG